MANSITYKSILSTKASKEMITSWNWYEERQAGLGDKFLYEVIKRLKQVELTPERYPLNFKTYRTTHIEVFPFSIIYTINKKQRLIKVVSIFHTSRNPKSKYRK